LFHLGGGCRPDTGRLPGKTMRRQFREHLPPIKGPRRSRNSENGCPILNRFGVEYRGRDFGQNRGVHIVRSLHPMLYDEDAIGRARRAEFCRSRFGFSLGRKPKERARTKGTGPAGRRLAERCYQTCYHFIEKAARNRMNQGPPGWFMSLNYKEQHETRRNINQTQKPKVGGSNWPGGILPVAGEIGRRFTRCNPRSERGHLHVRSPNGSAARG
jgi:hypothetical protein